MNRPSLRPNGAGFTSQGCKPLAAKVLHLVAMTALICIPLPSARAATPGEVYFEKHIRPVLIEQCHKCHGPKKQSSGLRLDSRASLLKGGEGGPAIKVGDPDGSLLMKALRHQGELKMPAKKLPAATIAHFAAWVKVGAPWPKDTTVSQPEAWKKHWAFQPVRAQAVPSVKDPSWGRNPIDRFIAARRDGKKLPSSPEADRRTLLRRVTFDLTGLPPTPREIDAFVNDKRPGAYERVVDRLLASPRHGERWARFWLDVARYADTKGYVFFEETNYPWGWTYRDYLIESFNEDRPWDRMILEQLAADQLKLDKDRKPLRGLGFVTLGGRFMNNVHDILDDRIDVVTRGFLGLTVSCARCHDHKFDPIPTADYYSLYGVFASSRDPVVPPLYADPPRTPVYVAFQKEMTKREKALLDFVANKLTEVRKGARTRVTEYLLAAHARRGQPKADEFMLIADGNDLNPMMIARYQAYLERSDKTHRVWGPWHAYAGLSEKGFAEQAKKVLLPGKMNSLVAKQFTKPPATMKEVAGRYGKLLNDNEAEWRKLIVEAQKAKKPTPTKFPDADREELRLVFHANGAAANLKAGLVSDLELFPDRASQGKLQAIRKAVEQWRATGAGAPPRAMVLEDATLIAPRVFRRGNPNNLGPRVPRQFLEALAGKSRKPFTTGSGRLDLARAIASKENPLTARVMVNRLWMNHLGRGIVRTPGDFGLRGEAPTHPELLDWLAKEFMDNAWSLKHVHRLIVTSETYRQASADRAASKAIDPDNVLLWRMNRRRLEFEALRDSLLVVGNQLDGAIGGPSVQGAMSPGVRRRTLYSWVDRLHVPILFRAFDFPGPDTSSVKRDTTTVPQQALFFMNNAFTLHAARTLAGRKEIAAEKDRVKQIDQLYRLCYGRLPDAEERALAEAFLTTIKEPLSRYAHALLQANEFAFVD